ncbi:MAG: prolyl oligopeptidase family serine peptidase [Bryobacteraceae bacterium]|nr:prolyl oligopeptidase family serine peptidase [Bryobacteraceae bacterium]
MTLLVLVLAGMMGAADRPVPPPGVPVPDADKAALENGLKELSAAIAKLGDHDLAPDVLIFREAVRYALTYNEFFRPDEFGKARELLRQGMERAAALRRGDAPWTRATGLVVRGYRSRIDDSIQPYGLVIPADWDPKSSRQWRLDAWFHGRSEMLSEVNFLTERQSRPGEFTPRDAIVLHLYGRYCNANKFAGEVDLFEALRDVRRHYRIDDDRLVMRGFSMGGAAAWHIAAHHAGRWAAAAPGAGFSETADFLKVFQNEAVKPNWWEQKLWRMYDATEYALNFFNLPLVAYSGEIDRQKQAADIMEKHLNAEGMRMTHIIGPKTAHRYHPDSKIEIDRRIDAIAARGRDAWPAAVKFTTYTLRYNRMKWVVVDGLEQHWEKAVVNAELDGAKAVRVATKNVSALTLDFGPGGCPLTPAGKIAVTLDGATIETPGPMSDRSWRAHFRREGGKWQATKTAGFEGLAKRHGLQGPIDDAFMSRFLFVMPSGTLSGAAGRRIEAEMKRAVTEWRRQFRGDARVKKDSEVTDEDIASSNLVLWGDPTSNTLLGRVAGQLPVKWSANGVTLGANQFDAATHYPVLVYPNPLNPRRYVVVNSGFTFREYDYLNNARQIAKLPDWAFIDARVEADGRWPGKAAAGGFFGERWEAK